VVTDHSELDVATGAQGYVGSLDPCIPVFGFEVEHTQAMEASLPFPLRCLGYDG
jgi:hypothetical protein